MNKPKWKAVMVGCALLLGASCVWAQDWPQWRGVNREAKVTGFTAPKTWPKELTEKWKVTVGEGVASPALVGDKLYVFSRQSGNEIIRCLDAASGKELWQDKYETSGARGPAAGFSGPRASPAVADGKVVTFGLHGILSCYDAAEGKKLWRNEDYKRSEPRFSTASSPMIVDGLAIVQVGSGDNGSVVACELAGGKEKWKWTGDGTPYASPALLTLGDTKVVVAETTQHIVGLDASDGKLLWKTSFPARGMRDYNASSPMVEGQTVICSGSSQGTKAVKIEKGTDGYTAKEAWNNSQTVQFNTPVVKNGMVFGLSNRDSLFCITQDGKTAWTSSLGGGGGRRSGYGSVVDAGPVLMALTPAAQLTVFEPSDKEFKKLASYKVGTDTYAYPIVAGNRIFVKDRDSVTLWTIVD